MCQAFGAHGVASVSRPRYTGASGLQLRVCVCQVRCRASAVECRSRFDRNARWPRPFVYANFVRLQPRSRMEVSHLFADFSSREITFGRTSNTLSAYNLFLIS